MVKPSQVKEIMERKKWTFCDLAILTGVSQSTLWRFVFKPGYKPRIDAAKKINILSRFAAKGKAR